MDYKGKKLLVLGGAFQHSKVVEGALRSKAKTLAMQGFFPDFRGGKITNTILCSGEMISPNRKIVFAGLGVL